MIPSIDIRSSVAVYVQIENHVQFNISAGRLKPGDRLPTVRELSEKLGINANTVAKAYRDLEVMGLIYTRRGLGVFINKNVEVKCAEECRRKTIERIFEVTCEAKAAGMQRKDILSIVEACLGYDVVPYAETPDKLLEMAKLAAKAPAK
jgi:GntR family transcriptional regulator